MHLKPFYFDPNYVTPLNIATRDTEESVVQRVCDSSHCYEYWLDQFYLLMIMCAIDVRLFMFLFDVLAYSPYAQHW